MSDELIPCPFCGSVDVVCDNGWNEDGWWAGHCRDCRAQGPASLERTDALDAWNRRVPAQGASGPVAGLPDGEELGRLVADANVCEGDE